MAHSGGGTLAQSRDLGNAKLCQNHGSRHGFRSKFAVLVFFRGFFTDPKDLAPAKALISGTHIYPLGKEDSARPMQFPDASNVPVNMLFPSDGSYFQMLSRFIDSEVVETANLDWRGMLAGIGIVKGQPFEPDERTKAILDNAAKTAFKMTKVLAFDGRSQSTMR